MSKVTNTKIDDVKVEIGDLIEFRTITLVYFVKGTLKCM